MTRLHFGERAAWYERRLPANERPLVVFELGTIDRALPAMIRLRLELGSLAIAPLIDPPRSALVERLAQQIFAQHRDREARATALHAYAQGTLVVSGRPVREIGPYDPLDLAQLREALVVADTVIAATWTSGRTIETIANVRAARLDVLEPPAGGDPIATHADARTVVIWDRTGHSGVRAWFAFALRNCAADVVVAGPGDEAQLTSARVVVLTDAATPLEAWRLAGCGAALVVDRLSGAHEWLAGAIVFDRADVVDIARAVRTAFGAPAPRARPIVPAEISPATPRRTSQACAAIVIRTKDRPALLERSLASLARQTHQATHAIVINDGGASVAGLVAGFTRVGLIERASSNYRTAANEAFAATNDAVYVGLLDDDDAIAPTHVADLVDALERSGRDLAVCGAVHVFVPSPEDLHVTGFAAYAAPAIERSALLVGNLVPGALRLMMRRAALAGIGWFNTDLAVAADFELWLRLTRSSDAVRVQGTNAAYTIFSNRANRSLAPGNAQRDALRLIYALHPVDGRQALIAARANLISAIERYGGYPVVPPARAIEPPVPLREKSFQG